MICVRKFLFFFVNWFFTVGDECVELRDLFLRFVVYQGHPTDCFGRISVRKTCNRVKFSVTEMSSGAFLIKIN